MKHLSLFVSICLLMLFYSCEKNNEPLTIFNPDNFQVEQRMLLPDCEDISVQISMKDLDCCIFAGSIEFIGINPPIIRLNGQNYTDFPPSQPGLIVFNFEVCSESAILEVIGLDSDGNEAVCWSEELLCNTCCASTSLQVIQATNNSNTGCCRYRVQAENNSSCEFSPIVGGEVHQTLFPGQVRNIDVTNCASQDPIDIFLEDNKGTQCKSLTLDCNACCDFGGTVSIRVNHEADPSEKPGCCIFRVRVSNPTGCNLELHLDGEFFFDIPPGFQQLVEVEVCGFGFSTLSVISPTAGEELECLSVDLENICSE